MSCEPWDPTGCVSDIAKSAASDAFTSIAHDFASAADSTTNWLWEQLGTATAIHLGGSGFSLDLGIVVTIAATVAVGLFVIQVITSVLRRDPGGLTRALRGLVVAFIGGGLAVGVTNVLLAAIDSLSSGVVQVATGQSLAGLGHEIVAKDAISSATGNPAALTLLSLAAIAAVVMVWAALMVRKVLIVVTAVFAPLAFAGSLADVTASWTRRWVELVVALIVSKLVLVIIFVVGLGMLVDGVGQAGSGTTQTATQAVTGLLVLVLAGFSPWLALRLVHWSGGHLEQLHGLAATSTAGAQRTVTGARKVGSMAMSGFGGGAGAAAGGGISPGVLRGAAGAVGERQSGGPAGQPVTPGATYLRIGGSAPPSSGPSTSRDGSGGPGQSGPAQSPPGVGSPRTPQPAGIGSASGPDASPHAEPVRAGYGDGGGRPPAPPASRQALGSDE